MFASFTVCSQFTIAERFLQQWTKRTASKALIEPKPLASACLSWNTSRNSIKQRDAASLLFSAVEVRIEDRSRGTSSYLRLSVHPFACLLFLINWASKYLKLNLLTEIAVSVFRRPSHLSRRSSLPHGSPSPSHEILRGAL